MGHPARAFPNRENSVPNLTLTVNRRAVPKPPLFATWLIVCVVAFCAAEALASGFRPARDPFLFAYLAEAALGVFAVLAMRTDDDGRLRFFDPFWKLTAGRVHPAAAAFVAITAAGFFACLGAIEAFGHPTPVRERAVPVLFAMSCGVACIELYDFIRRTTRGAGRPSSRGSSRRSSSGSRRSRRSR